MSGRKIRPALLVGALLALPAGIAAGAEYSLQNGFGMSVSVEPKTGDYSVLLNGQQWFGPGRVSVLSGKRWYRSTPIHAFYDSVERPEGQLALRGVKTGSDGDVLGTYDFIDLEWDLPQPGKTLVTGFRLYRDNPYLVFVQKFPNGFAQYASGDWRAPSVVFPQFLPDIFASRNDLFAWTSQGMFNHKLGNGNAAAIAGTVDLLVLADQERNTAVLSPFANYLVATQQSGPLALPGEISRSVVSCGIEGLVTELPAGFEHQHILVAGSGVHNTFENWGRALLKRAGKPVPSKYADDVLKYFVYMDDYGSYYREHGFKEPGYNAYEDIVLGLEKDARAHNVRIGAYFVLDADQIRYQEGLFEPQPALFPHGIERLHEQLGKPLQCYTLWLAPGGPYRKQFPFVETEKRTGPWKSNPPTLGDVFYSLDYWRYTAKKIASWGAISLQHDFLSNYEGDPVMMASVDKMNTYFKNMGQALQEQGMTMHYCMQLPRNIMQSTENPVMVSVQASLDHHVGDGLDPRVWKHLIFTSAFYGALGIWPSRDNMQSGADPNAFEDVLLANLMGGSMELGHRIGEADWDLLKKVYREGDGLVLKPDRPIVPLDRCYFDGSAVGYTESNISGKRWYYVLSLPASGSLAQFSASDTGAAGAWAVFDWDRKSVSVGEASSPIPLLREAKHQYFVLAPILENGMALFGDTGKFISMADQRIAAVESAGKSLRVGVIASREESPILVGYSPRRPSGMEMGENKLEEATSLDLLKAARSGWFWDPQTNLWSAKLDFSGAPGIRTRWLTIH
jgi:hypothetical protein